MTKIVASITCDIQSSSKYSTFDRKEINRILIEKFSTLSNIYRNDIHTPTSFSFIEGDEFQFVLSRPEIAFEVVAFYRILAALEKIHPMLTFRASIGIGEIAIETGTSSYSQDGEAFHLSRLGMKGFTKSREMQKRDTIIITNDKKLNENIDIILMYQDLIKSRWTLEQIEAIRWRFEKISYKKIAEKIGVAWQNIQKRLKAAYWDQFYHGLKFIEKLIGIHLSKGET